MKAQITILACVLAAIFWGFGCAHQSGKTGAQLPKNEVIRIAEAKARSEGFDLQKYNMTGCHYEFTEKDRTWTVFFQLKPPTPPGGHFVVCVDDQTKKATLMRGK
jgi:hypothetical protein